LSQHVGHDPMGAHLRPAGAFAASGIGHLTQKCNHTQFLHQWGIEGNFIEPIENVGGSGVSGRSRGLICTKMES
jgi:hypothetical protein